MTSNMKLIYSFCEENKVTNILPENIYKLFRKLGLGINFDEAKVLFADTNKKSDQGLTMNKFLDWVYNKNDAPNVNLDNLASKFTLY